MHWIDSSSVLIGLRVFYGLFVKVMMSSKLDFIWKEMKVFCFGCIA